MFWGSVTCKPSSQDGKGLAITREMGSKAAPVRSPLSPEWVSTLGSWCWDSHWPHCVWNPPCGLGYSLYRLTRLLTLWRSCLAIIQSLGSLSSLVLEPFSLLPPSPQVLCNGLDYKPCNVVQDLKTELWHQECTVLARVRILYSTACFDNGLNFQWHLG